MTVFTRILQTLVGYLAGLLSLAFGLVAAWSIIAIFLPYWDLVQRGLWAGAGLISSLLAYLLYHRSLRLTQ